MCYDQSILSAVQVSLTQSEYWIAEDGGSVAIAVNISSAKNFSIPVTLELRIISQTAMGMYL